MIVREFVLDLIRRIYPSCSCSPLLGIWQHTAVSQVVERLDTFGGAVLADEVGTGKSYIAAAVAAEYVGRGIAPEFIVPASLIPQWRALLATFEITAPVRSHDSLLRDGNEPSGESRLLVVDEAHRFRNPSTKRYRALALRSIGSRVLLVTATPVCNKLSDLLSILRLFASDDILRSEGLLSIERCFASPYRKDMEIVLQELLIRRGPEVLPLSVQFADLSRHVIRYPLAEGSALAASLVSQLQFPLIATSSDTGLLRRTIWRRLESSDAAFFDSLTRQRRFYRRALEAARDGCRMTKKDYRALFGDEGEDVPFQDLMFMPFWIAPGMSDTAAIEAELVLIDELLRHSRPAENSRKLDLLKALVGGEGIPTLIFTFAVATARHLLRELNRSFRCGLVTAAECRFGSGEVSTPVAVFRSFMQGEIDLLIATDLAAEGLNLQRAGRVVHYDLPWNPVKLDQRNGRARRLGQEREKVACYYFIPSREDDLNAVVANLSGKKRSRRLLLDVSRDGYDPYRFQSWSDLALASSCSSSHLRWMCCPAINESGLVLTASCLRRGGVAARRQRVAIVSQESLSFRWSDIAEWLRGAGESEIVPTEGEPVWLRASLSAACHRLKSRAAAPSVLADVATRTRWMQRLTSEHQLSDRACLLLSKSYRAGVEIRLKEGLKESPPLDSSRMLSILEAEFWQVVPGVTPIAGIVGVS